MIGICLVYSIYIYGIFSFSGFRGQHHNRPDPVPQDIPDDVLPDPDDLADFELPDPQALIDAFLDGLCKESAHEFRNDLSGRDIHFRFGDHLYRRSRVFLDFLCMDGDEVSSATMCPTTQCTTCWCPKARLSDPDAVFPFRNTEEVREKVAAERRRLLNRDGTPRDRCKAEVWYIFCKYVIY